MHIGIDTSCYTTSVAAVCKGKILFDKKIMLSVKEGKRGLRQSDAVFLHTRNLSEIMGGCNTGSGVSVSVAARPRNVSGSYMPVFLAGICAAKTLQSALGCKYNEFSHQQGHIMAGLYSAGALHWVGSPFLAFHISGGTTEMLLVKGENLVDIEIVGKTLDISAGQLIDRVGVNLGLAFPCGKELELLAENATEEISLPVSVSGMDINFSGAEFKAMRLSARQADVADAVLQCVARSVKTVIENAKETYNLNRVIMVGGVAANKQLRRYIGDEAVFASPKLSCDNAVGIALLGEMN
ncbi:MAG: hypothetical protein M0R40_03320 [Firmicutes bacterium]|nr:hypothetical protein [Bacillota bacterium]